VRNNLLLVMVLISNLCNAIEINLKIDHHGEILNKIELDRSKIQLFEDEFNKDLQFDSERLEQYFKTISDVVPPNTFVVLLGDSSDVINEISNTYFLRQISLSHTGEDHIHPPEMFFDEVLDIDISLNDNQKSIFILQKSKLALRPVKKLILN
tara:strand:+ start:2853 stop:3311 length:459 start_codon:yes stop_codon:yes gene_type:complete